MAKAVKTPEGTWRIQFMVKGVRDGGTFPTKRDADAYAARRRTEIESQGPGKGDSSKTLLDAFKDYALKVIPDKKGHHHEVIRLKAFEGHGLPLNKKLGEVTTADLAQWRDRRLQTNSPGSVLRDITLMRHVFEIARKDWQWISVNPMTDMTKPKSPNHRTRVITFMEIRNMLRQCRYRPKVRTVSHAVAHAFLFALSTGMRAKEICDLKWSDVKETHAVLHTSKTGVGRNVPLSKVALRILERMKEWDEESVFGLTTQTLDANFRKYRTLGGMSGFTFHDSRHTAATRIAMLPGIHVLILCQIFGWKNPAQAMVYFNPSAKTLASLV